MRSELREQLAEIEHQRWSDWQQHLHDRCEPQPDGSLLIPKELVDRWTLQIGLPYRNLPECDKDSSRQQVDRAWHIIEGIRANYGDEVERLRQVHQTYAARQRELEYERDVCRADLMQADQGFARLAVWLSRHLTVDQQTLDRLNGLDRQYIVDRTLELLDVAGVSIGKIWPLLLDKLQPLLMALVTEADVGCAGGTAHRADASAGGADPEAVGSQDPLDPVGGQLLGAGDTGAGPVGPAQYLGGSTVAGDDVHAR